MSQGKKWTLIRQQSHSMILFSSPVMLRWRLHFEFVTAREPVEAPLVLQNQSEVTVWTGAEHVDVDTFSWDLPIKVLPTNPTLASYVSQFTGTNSINIWVVLVFVQGDYKTNELLLWDVLLAVYFKFKGGLYFELFYWFLSFAVQWVDNSLFKLLHISALTNRLLYLL